jgi:hypothetical protein
MKAGPRTAVATTATGGHQPPADPAPGPEPAPGTARIARPAAITAAGTHRRAASPAVPVAICRRDAPRALSTVISGDRRIATIRAASSSTARAAAVRLT